MKSFIIKEGIVWLSLVVLTLLGYYNSSKQSGGVAYFVLGVGLLKFFLIFFDFMEMKHAHRAWQVAMTSFMLLVCTAISLSL